MTVELKEYKYAEIRKDGALIAVIQNLSGEAVIIPNEAEHVRINTKDNSGCNSETAD